MKIVITGAGVVSAIGVGKEQNLRSLMSMQTGVAPVRYQSTEHHECMVGEVKLTNEEMRLQLGIDSNAAMVRTSLLGMLALREALDEAGLTSADLPQTAFLNGTTVGGMDQSEQHYLEWITDNNGANVDYIRTHDCGSSTDLIADHFGRFGLTTSLSTACSSAANAMILGARMIASGQWDRVVAGGAESLSKFHLNGFNTLMILDPEPCRPMDATRAGLNLGEGAAYLVLEREDSARKRGARVLATLAGFGNACDAFHQTASSPEGDGAFLAMQQALQQAGIAPEKVDYINCHGTGTPNNDPSELQAMRRLFGEALPAFSSTKGYTGHTTSASGSIEAVFCLLALQQQMLWPNLRFASAIEPWAIPVQQPTKAPVHYVLCNAFGFGGNDSSVLLASPDAESDKASGIGQPKEAAPLYVCAANQISMQMPLSEEWLDQPIEHSEPFCRATDPDFREFVSPVEGRRMGRMLKRILATSLRTLRQCGVEHPDAIVTGTGLGSVESTEAFLLDLCQNGEQLLKPTHFMQSTHNTIGSLVAIQTKSHGYNATYSHKLISFESALADAVLQLQAGAVGNALVLGQDATTDNYFRLLEMAGYVGNGMKGTCSEASMATLIATQPADGHVLCRLMGVQLLHRPSTEDWRKALDSLPLTAQTVVLTGENGNPDNDALYTEWLNVWLPGVQTVRYKQWFGECFSASALGFYAAAHLIHAGHYESLLLLNLDRAGDAALTLLSR